LSNDFLQFYGEHSISPVSQDISDFEAHRQRRLGLYRALGIAPALFRDADVLEVAPGSGHNSIVTASLGLASYRLVEPNKVGYDSLIKMMSSVSNHCVIEIFNDRFEDLILEKSYDIVLCEGLLPGLTDNENFFNRLVEALIPGGVLVVTCVDSCSYFFESLRRYVGLILLSESGNLKFEEKVRVLGEAFGTHLSSLRGVTRPLEDWVSDNLLNPAAFGQSAENMFSIENFLDFCGDRMFFYHASPNLFSDPRWYKATPASPCEFNETPRKEYELNLHRLINIMDPESASGLRNGEIRRLCREFSNTCQMRFLSKRGALTSVEINLDVAPLRRLALIFAEVGLTHSKVAIDEFFDLLDDLDHLTSVEISNCLVWAEAWGRGQQYLSGVKV